MLCIYASSGRRKRNERNAAQLTLRCRWPSMAMQGKAMYGPQWVCYRCQVLAEMKGFLPHSYRTVSSEGWAIMRGAFTSPVDSFIENLFIWTIITKTNLTSCALIYDTNKKPFILYMLFIRACLPMDRSKVKWPNSHLFISNACLSHRHWHRHRHSTSALLALSQARAQSSSPFKFCSPFTITIFADRPYVQTLHSSRMYANGTDNSLNTHQDYTISRPT